MPFGPIGQIIGAAVMGGGQAAANYQSTRDTNRVNRSMMRETNEFNRQQAIQARDFADRQATNQMHFQQSETRAARKFAERMSSTALQRGVADAKAAGLHPSFLTGGASSPSVGAPSGAAGSGPAASGTSATMRAPQIQLPDLLSFGLSLKQLEIADRKATADILKSTSDKELNEVKKKLFQKGMPRALLEGRTSNIMEKMIDWMEKKFKQDAYQQPGSNRMIRQPDDGLPIGPGRRN